MTAEAVARAQPASGGVPSVKGTARLAGLLYGHILAAGTGDVLSILVAVLAVPGGLAFTVWPLWRGVDVERWEERAGSARRLERGPL